MSELTKYSAEIEFTEGNETDFKELHDAIKDGKAGQNEFKNHESNSEDDEKSSIMKKLQEAMKKSELQKQNTNSSSSEEEEEQDEPDSAQPGPRLLWAAQYNKVEILEEILVKNLDVITFTDEDGYTALHRAAYSGSKVYFKNYTIMYNKVLFL